MSPRLVLPFLLLALAATAQGDEKKPYTGAGCAAAPDAFFIDEVWARVGAQICLTCHKKGGEAEDSKFLLQDPRRVIGTAHDEAVRHNRDAFAKMAAVKEKDESRLLLKVTGKLGHGGKDVLKPDSPGYRTLATFVRRVNDPRTVTAADLAKVDPMAPPFFDGVVMLDDRRLLRRLTLSLAGRLPTEAERTAVAKDGRKALPAILDAVMKEDAFYLRLREGFNDVFLTLGVDGNADQTVLSYDHFPHRHWYQKHDLSHIKDEKARTQAGYKLAREYRQALLDEPMRLIEHIVRNDKPFTEVVTADYILMSPYTSRGYGVFDEVKDKFKNPDDPFEYIPVKLKALTGRDKSNYQDSTTGFYPHAGLLSTFQYLTRYPTTETNRNRLRARMYYQHFLGVDVLELAARVTDAAAAQAKFEVPTMQAAECVVCHKTLDPVSGLFQDYWRFAERGVYGKRKGGWFKDMFGPGFEGEDLPSSDRWRALQWLGERTAKDPRFAVAMVEHVYYILTGRKALLPPKDLDDPLFGAKRRAYQEQRREVERIAARFVAAKFNLKTAFQEWAASPFYRADGLATAVTDPKRCAELDDIGLVRMLSPEQVERKLAAVFGDKWGRLTEQTAMLYGGIDSQEVTDRATDPSGAMGAIQRILSNDVACKHVARDFRRPVRERKLFPTVDADTLPGTSPDSDAAIRKTIVHLHDSILGRSDAVDSAEVGRTYKLFAGIVEEAKGRKGVEKQESYYCRPGNADAPGANVPDPHYTIRAWRAVVTYLLRRQEFLYE